MSLVGDVLASFRVGSRERSGRQGVEAQLDEVTKQAEEAKFRVVEALGSRYSQLTTALHDTTYLHNRLTEAQRSVKNLTNTIDNEVLNGVKSSIGEVGCVVKRWREAVVGLEAATTLLNIHTALNNAQAHQLEHRFLSAAKNLAEVEKMLQEASEKDVEGNLDIIAVLKEELLVRRTQLLYTVGEVWNETISWEEQRESDGSRVVSLLVRLAMGSSSSSYDPQQLQEMIGASYLLGELQRLISALATNLMKHFFEPIINQGCEVKATERSDGMCLQLTHPPRSHNSHAKQKASAAVVFVRLQQVLLILQRTLLWVTVYTENKADEKTSVTLMQLLGKEIKEEFKEVVIRDCLADAVPYSRAQLDQYEDVKRSAQEFQKFLIDQGFFDASDQSLLEYAANVDVVFSNKACAHILERARELMKRPIHVTVCITPLEPGGSVVIRDENAKVLEKSTMRLEKLLAAKSLNLPKCQISSSVCELVELIYETLEEACSSSPLYAGRLFYTVRNILSLYCHIVPTAHAHQLATLPQQAAIVHNNSMYLAHHALFLGHQYRLRLPKALRDASLTTTDLAQQLRAMATSTFLRAMQTHRTALIDTLRRLCIETLGSDGSCVSKAQQGMRQVLHQLQLLHRVWQNVLPHTVYTKAIGTLVGSVVEEVVVRVVGLEDISADAALALINILNILKDFVPSLFQVEGESRTSPGDVVRVVRLWPKFCELIVVLGASLRDIADRWADGKGLLAHEFTADEVKQLVRALFQNTDRRAQVLARIK